MVGLKLGVDVNDLRLPVKEGIRTAAELEFRAVELAAVAGEVCPAALSESARRHLSRYVAGFGLDIAALVADVPHARLTDPQTVDERVERTGRIIDLARDLQVPVVTASVGALTHPETGEPSPLALQALRHIGELAESRGIVYAIRPSHESGDRTASVLDSLRCPSIRVGIDPAALAISGGNPLQALETLAGMVSLFHVRDATAGFAERPGRETPLGEGEVDIVGLIDVLSASHYSGPYILRRTDSARPAHDIREARDYLCREISRRR